MKIAEKYTEKLKTLVVALHQKNENAITKMSAETIYWRVEQQWGNSATINLLFNKVNEMVIHHKIIKIDLHKITIFKITDDIVQVSGGYELVCSNMNKKIRIGYEILATYQNGMLLYLQLLQVRGIGSSIHKVRATNKDCFQIDENEVLYVEANHNHVIWNCMRGKITSNDSLHHLETELSDRFVRIQRGYLVNKDYVKSIRRCEVVMENEDVLQIPSKRYTSVREKLMQ